MNINLVSGPICKPWREVKLSVGLAPQLLARVTQTGKLQFYEMIQRY